MPEAAGAGGWELGLAEESAAADLTPDLTQLRLSDDTRDLSVVLKYQMSKYKKLFKKNIPNKSVGRSLLMAVSKD